MRLRFLLLGSVALGSYPGALTAGPRGVELHNGRWLNTSTLPALRDAVDS